MPFPVEAVLFVFLLVMAVTIAKLRDLFAAAMLTGIFSLLSAGVFTLMEAVDVAFTEAAVGAGIATVLLLATLALTRASERGPARVQPLPLIVVVLTGAALLYATPDMPHYGDPNAPIHQHVAPRYIEQSPQEVGVQNLVTAVLASYRSYDTLGELTVIFMGGIGVMLALGSARRRARIDTESLGESVDGRKRPMREKVVLRAVTKALVPLIILFAIYVQAHGDYGPGGGFQAGVIFAAAFILYAMIFGPNELRRVAKPNRVEVGFAVGLLLFIGVGIAALAFGGNFLDYSAFSPEHPTHGQHIGILLIELGVGITVASVMLTIYFNFAGTQQ